MVRLASMVLGLLGVTSVSAASASEDAFLSLPTFEIPAFDYASLAHDDMPSTLLETLQMDGIVALRHVPNFVNMREKYLNAAAVCAVAAANSAESNFLSEKNFEDGTRRYTINTNAGLELDTAAENTRQLCPGYRELYLEFSALLENAVNGFGVALDQTSFTASDGHRVISSRQLMSEAVRLDHFHAYQASATQAEAAVPANAEHRKLEFSLPLHEDHGLFIAMVAPKFFEVHEGGNERRLVERELANDASGLVIQRASGQKVRPVLKEDEVFIMMGTGGSRWLHTSHRIPAVMHGMRMPDSLVQNEHRSLRAWFGKMTLLPTYQRLLENNAVTFEEHANMTTRFLLESTDDDLKTIGCATGRMLTASEGSCTHRSCTTKSGATAPGDGCATVCNREGHSSADASECSQKCSCTDDSGSGELCWMLCVATLDSCDTSAQTCSGQALVCDSSSTTPTPTTATPATTTAAPATTSTPATTSSPATTTSSPSTTPSPSSGASPASTTSSPSSGTSSPSPSDASASTTSSTAGTGTNSDTTSGGTAATGTSTSTNSQSSSSATGSVDPTSGSARSGSSNGASSSNAPASVDVGASSAGDGTTSSTSNTPATDSASGSTASTSAAGKVLQGATIALTVAVAIAHILC